tara:strand:- start:401 stop:664 length:264 start_codon:yes stop_codon:yes gene_type:complete
MKMFIYKSLIVVLLIFVLFHATFGYMLRSYEEKFYNTFSKDQINSVKNKVRAEIKKGLDKDRILEKDDALMIKKFIDKISKEINNLN